MAETSMALVLMVGAGLLINSFVRLGQVDPGFRPDGAMIIEVQLGTSQFSSPEFMAAVMPELTRRIAAIPGVTHVGGAMGLPLGGAGGKGPPLTLDSHGDEIVQAAYDQVGPGYFGAMGIDLLPGGRDFEWRDMEEGRPVVIVNEAFVREYWPGEDPLTHRLRFGPAGRSGPWTSVIGVVEDIKGDRLQEASVPQVFQYFLGTFWGPPIWMVARSERDPAVVLDEMRRAVWGFDPSVPIGNVMTMSERVAQSITEPRFYTLLLSTFAGVAVLLALVGIYGTVSYAVEQRTHELGVRIALGASKEEVLRLVVGGGMAITTLGVVLGLGGAWLVSRVLEGFVFGVTTTDAPTFAAMAGVLTLAALLACYLPAVRATRVDPLVTMKAE